MSDNRHLMIEAWTTLQLGAPSDGDERDCGGCYEDIPAGEEIWWAGGDDGDALCGDCAMLQANGHAAIVADLDAGRIVP